MREGVEPTVKILHIEDQPADSLIVQGTLDRSGLDTEIHRVATLQDFTCALEQGRPALILSDYSLPGMDVLDALRFARRHRPEIPFIFFSGTLGEEQAIDCLKLGATDYVLKQRLNRLAPAVRRALAEAQEFARRKKAEQALDRTREVLAGIIEGTPDLIAALDSGFRYLAFNEPYRKEFKRIFGTDIQVGGSMLESLAHLANDQQSARELWERALKGEAFTATQPFGDPSRARQWFELRFSPIRDAAGRTVGAAHIVRDITVRKHTEEALKLSEQRYRSFVEATNHVIWRTNAHGEADQPIPSWNAFTGQTEAQAGGLGWMNAIHPDDRPRVTEAWREASTRKTTYQVEYRLLRHDGRWLHILARAVPLMESDGRIREYIGTCIDITAQRETEEHLRRSEQKFRSIFEQAAIGIGLVSITDARWLEVNEPFCRTLGYIPEFMRTTPWTQITHPDDVDRDLIPFRRMAAGELNSYSVEKRFIHADGHHVWARLTLSLVRDAQGRPDYEIAIIEDIDARKKAEAQLQRQARLIDLSPTATIVRSPAGVITFWSAGAEALYGWTSEEALGHLTHELLRTEFPMPLSELIAELRLGGKWSGELRQRTKNGNPVVIESHWLGQLGPDGGVVELLESNMDITARTQAEHALRRRTLHLQILHQTSARLLVGQPPVELLRELHPQVADALGADAFMLYQADPGDGRNPERLHLLASGGITEEQHRMLEALRYGRAICVRHAEALQPIVATHIQTREAPNRRFVRKLGFRSYISYPLILNNQIHGTLAFASRTRDDYDPTDLEFFHTLAGTLAEAFERQRLQAALQRHTTDLERTVQERTAKLRDMVAELEHFSYTITHDLRAPLRAMRGLSGMLLEECGSSLGGERLEYLHRIADSADRMDKLITDALQYSTIVRGEFALHPVDAGALLKSILASYPQFQSPHASIRVEGRLPIVLANEAGLTQCFSNLLGNAVKFVRPGQTPEVRVWAERVESGRPHPGAPDAAHKPEHEAAVTSLSTGRGYDQGFTTAMAEHGRSLPVVRIWFEDRGIGIGKEYQEKIWVMFQRLHKSYSGTGIGLALVHKAVERMGGRVGVESEPGQGSRFWVELRCADQCCQRRQTRVGHQE